MTEQQYQEKIDELQAEISLYKNNGGVGLYYELNRLVNETIDLSNSKKLKELLALDPKEDKSFERMQALIKNAKEHVLDMVELKTKLGLTGNREKDELTVPFIETVAETRR